MRRRVLVLGGGAGGVSAAWALSRTPELRQRFAVTLVQPGWRLGGKGATGRGRSGRIHEHGLHVWMGFYRHAFGMMADLYRAWRPPAGHPFPTIEAAFTPHHVVSLLDADGAPMHLRLPPRPGLPWDERPHRRAFLKDLARWARRDLPRTLAEASTRHVAAHLRLIRVILRGVARDGWGEALDEEDLCAWLRRHGGDDPEVYDAPAIRSFYNLAFAYPDGEAGFGRGALAAGPALRAMLRMLTTYRGAPFWKMNAGMGDTIFAPAYDVLRARGVDVRLLHRVDRLRVSGRSIDAVEVAVQAEVPQGWDALVSLGAQRVWPDRPAPGLGRVAGGDLEASDGPALDHATWRRGADFDDVVLAVPSPAHRRIASELMEACPRYRAMVEHSASVATIAAQLWLPRTLEQVGWRGPSTVATNEQGLFSSWADMTETVDAEAWPERPGLAAYFCDVAPDGWFAGLDRAGACAAVRDRAERWAREDLPRTFGNLGEVDLDAGYFRANTDDWERYVLTLPGSTKYRLPPEASGFENLVLAGDWTRTSIDGGSVEAAAESGVRAATALIG